MSENKITVKCNECQKKNSIPMDKLDKPATCGNCKAPLSLDYVESDTPIELSDAQFDLFIKSMKIPVLVDFWAPWCGPCRMIAPILEQVSKEYAGKIVIAKVNTDNDQLVAQRFQITGIPTLIIFKNSKAVHTQIGGLPKHLLVEKIKQFL